MDLGLIGRDGEAAEISAFLSAALGAPAALAIMGDAGIGKTMVWKHSVQAASRSSRVLRCGQPWRRPLAFSALYDLFAGVVEEVLPALAGPRRRAVEAALLRDVVPKLGSPVRSEADCPPPERRVLARGILDALRVLSGSAPLTVAVDDAQWLDRPSARVLEFCFRRMLHEPVLIMLTLRGEDPLSAVGPVSAEMRPGGRWTAGCLRVCAGSGFGQLGGEAAVPDKLARNIPPTPTDQTGQPFASRER